MALGRDAIFLFFKYPAAGVESIRTALRPAALSVWFVSFVF
jgi:hypothetical protein